jgi:uncharacterized protein
MKSRRGLIGRRGFSMALVSSPLALATANPAGAQQAGAQTAPVRPASDEPFERISPVAMTKVEPRVRTFPLGAVRLLEGPFRDAQQVNTAYMKRLLTDRLLHNFRVTAGLPSRAQPLGGWEAPDCELRGHFVGHYLSGAAIAYAATGDTELRDRGAAIVAGLAECQATLGRDGYLSAFPSSFFDRLAATGKVWVPFYTVHKVMAGLLDMHQLAGDPKALPVLLGMAAWVDRWTAAQGEDRMQKILEVEFGGMNELLYNLAEATDDERWIDVGDRFTKKRVLNPLAGRRDELRGLHMNTHAPQLIGAARRYELSGDYRFRDAASFFWDTVVHSRTFATGGSSNDEHWQAGPNRLHAEWSRSDNHQECCCAYNMMKLTTRLFTWAPRVEHMDYYERNLLNHRLGAIHPETGASTYFLSLAPGGWKVWATEDQTFWCCSGSAVEDYSRLGSMIYAHDASGVYVNLFIASELTWAERGVTLRQETTFPTTDRTTLVVKASDGKPWTLRLRIPGWTGEACRVRINGKSVEAMAEPGSYLKLTRAWKAGDRIELEAPMTLSKEAFPDDPEIFAVRYGPVVLAQQLPLGKAVASLTWKNGVDLEASPPLAEPAALPADVIDRMERVSPTSLAFEAKIASRRVLFKPVSDSFERFAAYSRTAQPA